MALLKYRIYFSLFELSLQPSIRLFKKWRDAKGKQRDIYREKMEIVIFASAVVYVLIAVLCVYIVGVEKFQEAVWLAIIAKGVFIPVATAVRWISSRTIFRKEVIQYVKGRKDRDLLGLDMMVIVIPGIILYFAMLPFMWGVVTTGILYSGLFWIAYRDSLSIRNEVKKVKIQEMWKDHGVCVWSVPVWLVLYRVLGGSTKVTYVLPLFVFTPIVISMDLE